MTSNLANDEIAEHSEQLREDAKAVLKSRKLADIGVQGLFEGHILPIHHSPTSPNTLLYVYMIILNNIYDMISNNLSM